MSVISSICRKYASNHYSTSSRRSTSCHGFQWMIVNDWRQRWMHLDEDFPPIFPPKYSLIEQLTAAWPIHGFDKVTVTVHLSPPYPSPETDNLKDLHFSKKIFLLSLTSLIWPNVTDRNYRKCQFYLIKTPFVMCCFVSAVAAVVVGLLSGLLLW